MINAKGMIHLDGPKALTRIAHIIVWPQFACDRHGGYSHNYPKPLDFGHPVTNMSENKLI